MKILYLVPEDPQLLPNPYIYSLIKSIENQRKDFVWGYGVDIIWENDCFNYDVIHIHWPHVLTYSLNKNKKTLGDLVERIKFIKKGLKIVTTCHNLEPHYSRNKILHSLYNLIYSYSDYIIHLGSYSYNLFQKKYPNIKHVIIPHHTYDNIYKNNSYTQDFCKETLKLKKNKRYILCFGSFRHNEERNYIIDIAKKIKKYNIEVIAPSFCSIGFRKNLFLLLLNIGKFFYYKISYPYIHSESSFISDDKLPLYYGACDIAFIHRLKILNSGNVPMAFLMKKVVVGPNIGNVGCIIKEVDNPIFNIYEHETVISSILKGIELSENNKGEENYNFSMENYSSKIIGNKVYKLYKQCISYEK